MKTMTSAVLIAGLILTMLTSSACAKTDDGNHGSRSDGTVSETVDAEQAERASSGKQTITVKVGKKKFKAKIYKNKTTKKLQKKFPLKLRMEELNGNEKYKYLDFSLPAKAKKVKKIKAGDIMLYGDDCLVLFYKSFETSYEYTKIGRITNTKGLKKLVGKGSVTVRFSK